MENQAGNQTKIIRKPNAIETKYYFSQINELGTSTSRYIGQVIAQVGYQDMESLVIDALTVGSSKSCPTMLQTCLLDGASKRFIDKNSYAINQKFNRNQSSIPGWVQSRLINVPETERLELLERWMRLYSDFNGPFSMLSFCEDIKLQRCGITLADALQKEYSLTSMSSMKSLAIRCRDTRNKYLGHTAGITNEKLTCENFKACISDFGKLVELFSFKKCAQEKENVLKSIADAKIRVINPPLPLSMLTEKIPDFNQKQFLGSKFIHQYDSNANILYLSTLQEVKSFVAEQNEYIASASQLSVEEFRKYGSKLDQMLSRMDSLENRIVGGPTTASQAGAAISAPTTIAAPQSVPATVPVAPAAPEPRRKLRKALPNLQAYTHGHLTAAQQQELGKRCVVFADRSCWMNADGRQYLAYAPKRLGTFHLVVDWPTRVELYQRETNVGNRYAPNEIEQAHRARLQMHQMHLLGLIRYLHPVEEYITSQDYILQEASRHPDHRFCVLTQDRDFSFRVAACDNALPVAVLPGGECTLLSAARAVVKDFAAEGLSVQTPAPESPQAPVAPTPAPVPTAQAAPAPAPTPKPMSTPAPAVAREPSAQSVSAQASAHEAKVVGIYRSHYTVPQQGAVLRDGDGNTVTLGAKLGKGGEGAVYQVGIPDTVAKIYLEGKLRPEGFPKLQYMVAHNPHIPELCWPTALLYNKENAFVGFLMPRLPVDEKKPGCYYELGRSALAVNKPTIAHGIMQGWTRRSLVLLCKEICTVFARMHNVGILMGDVNPRNILLLPSSANAPKVKLVDCDSYQMGEFVCPVGTQAYTSPEIYMREKTDNPKYSNFKRTTRDEQYAIAVLLFKILMLNQSPWAGKGVGSIAEAIRSYNFAYRLGNDDNSPNGADVPDGPYRMVWNNLPREVKTLFGDVFAKKNTVTVQGWISALNKYLREIDSGRFTSDIIPTRYWDPDHKYTVDFTCDECGKQTNMPKERYENSITYHQPLLCNDCRSVMFRLKNTPANIPVVCTRCHQRYAVNQYDATMIERGKERGGYNAMCPNCRQEIRERRAPATIPMVCAHCNSSYMVNEYEVAMIKRGKANGGYSALCPDCLNEIRNRNMKGNR